MAGEPTVNPNELGAPAQGFGQTVSFAFDPRGQTPQQRVITSNGPRVGVSGGVAMGGKSPNNQIQVGPVDPTAALLIKASAGIMEKEVEKARNEQFVQGMQRAMEGEALEDIKASKPWYTKIFGDTPDIEGARAYTAQDTVNRVLTEQTANIKSLAELSPQEASKHFSQVMQGALTGDSGADSLVMKGLIDGMPALMKAQAKANVAHRQTVAANSMSRSINSGAAALQQFGESYADDTMDEKDFKARQDAFVMSALPPMGIDEESYKKTLTQSMLAMASQGQFHALEALRSRGVHAALDADQSRRVDEAAMTQGAKARDRYAFRFSKELAEIKSDSAILPNNMTPNELGAKIDKANSAYKRLTGSPVDLITSDQKADLLAGSLNYIKREGIKAEERQQTLRDKQATQDQKDAAAKEQAAQVSRFVADGDVQLAKKATKATDDEIDLEFAKQADANKESAPFLMLSNFVKSGYVNSIISNRFQSEMRLSEGFDPATGRRRDAPTDGWFKSVQVYDALKAQNPDMAASYFGEYGPRLERASRMLNGQYDGKRGDEARIFTSTMDRSGLAKRDPLTDKEHNALTEKIKDTNSNAVVRWFTGKTNLRADAIDTLSRYAKQATEDWRMADMTDQEAVERGVSQTLTSGKLEIIGGFAVKNPDAMPGKRPKSLRDIMDGEGANLVAVPADQYDEYFAGFLHEKMKVPTNLGATTFTRRGDGFVLTAMDPDTNQMLVFPFTNAALHEYAAERTKKDTGKKRFAYGPQITYTADVPNAQNFQIPAAERARRQAELERKAKR
jgi:hypothetical protein